MLSDLRGKRAAKAKKNSVRASNKKIGHEAHLRFNHDGVRDTIAEPLFLFRGPNEDCAEQIGNYIWDQIEKPQDRSNRSFGIIDRCAVRFSYDFNLNGHLPDSLSVVTLEQREVQNKDRERNKSADSTGQ